jgi:hypothetical protein
VMNTIEEALIHSSPSDSITPPLNIVEALIMAAIDENIHLDCIYSLFRREPDILQKLPSSTPAAVVVIDSSASKADCHDSKMRKRQRGT